MTSYGVHQLDDPEKGEAVLWAGVIDVGEVDAHIPLPALLLHQDRIG